MRFKLEWILQKAIDNNANEELIEAINYQAGMIDKNNKEILALDIFIFVILMILIVNFFNVRRFEKRLTKLEKGQKSR